MISTLTINTALDRLLFIQELHKNSTNRILKTEEVLGGKGTHVSINLSQLGVPNRVFGVTFGEIGERIGEILRRRGNIDVRFLHYPDGNSRTNYALIEQTNECTLITEKGRVIPADICEELLDHIAEGTAPGDFMVLSGDASNTETPFFYNRVMERVAAKGVRVFLDTSSHNLIEGIKAKPFLVKPNADELSQLAGKPIGDTQEILGAMADIAAQGVEVVAVSLGGEGSLVRYRDDTYRVEPLDVDVVNTIGCGDAYLSGMVCGFAQGLPFEDILRLACAVSAATAESEMTVGFDHGRAMALRERVVIRRL
ncbi:MULTISPECIES: 1-phosphofructokinase family hexose kinase [Anaerotruncus]|uniref:1-phosphofructokinase family hexose kinase n=1 Tax=Anaerotruncus TaxID=244127 RepID=UPI00136469B0|nr:MULTISPECIES: hexose kinase [Anaerotruncus]MCI8492582.1 hexose kinase [Anaerotruncus sp.]MCR2024568.1 1-phosphofructokinase family hexose kinase [Anaerotruncus colihominis]